MEKRIVIIGGGPGGYVAAVRAASLGGRVTLIEKENLGGTCLNWGCIPSKVMKHSTDLLESCLKAEKLGIFIQGDVHVDMEALMARKDKVLSDQRTGLSSLMARNGITVLSGRAVIQGPGRVRVTGKDTEGRDVVYDKLIIATGTKPLSVPDFPFDHERILSSNDLLSLKSVPESMVIVGGGVVGCEFAFIYSSLGCEVTLVEAMGRPLPLPSVDEACSKVLLREMKKRKIKVLCDTVVKGTQQEKDGLSLTLAPSPFTETPNPKPLKTDTISAGVMAVCIGRTPLSEDIGLSSIGLETDGKGFLKVNEHMETGVDGVYAVGDILGPSKVMLAHVASHEGLVAAENAMAEGGKKAVMSYDAVPGAIFTSPEIGTVGLSEQGAKAMGMAVETASVNFRVLGKAQAIDEIAGEAKLIVEKESLRVVGVHIIGPHASDLVAEATLAVAKGMTAGELAHVIHAHPTLAEVMGEVSSKLIGLPIHG